MTDSKAGIELAYIPAGTFMMGGARGWEGGARWAGGLPPHQVTLSQPFWMGTTEVTNAQYRRFLVATSHREPGTTHNRFWDNSKYNAPNQPVVGVSWDDAVAYAS